MCLTATRKAKNEFGIVQEYADELTGSERFTNDN